MRQILGILVLLVCICVFAAVVGENFLTAFNIENLFRRTALIGILAIGVAFVIMGRGIDLSIGSVVCLVGILTPWLIVEHGINPWLVVPGMIALSMLIGLAHGLLITRFALQSFVVTLCGLLIYRGIARGLTGDQTQGFKGEWGGLRSIATGEIPVPFVDYTAHPNAFAIPVAVLIMLGLAILGIILLRCTVYGRHLLATGRSEPVARYSGVNTGRVLVISYVISSTLAGIGGMLYVFENGSAQPVDFGNFYELYAIAAAVLGGCSLLGGQGSIVGTIIGAAVMVVLYNTIRLVDWIPNNIEMAVIGGVLLAGVIVDVIVKDTVVRRRVRRYLAAVAWFFWRSERYADANRGERR